jgi:hypothetical protein
MPTRPGRSRYLKPKVLSILANLENSSCSGARGFWCAAIIHDGKPICLYKSTYCARPGCQLACILTAAHRVLRTWKSSRTASLQYLLWGLAQSLSRTHAKLNPRFPGAASEMLDRRARDRPHLVMPVLRNHPSTRLGDRGSGSLPTVTTFMRRSVGTTD